MTTENIKQQPVLESSTTQIEVTPQVQSEQISSPDSQGEQAELSSEQQTFKEAFENLANNAHQQEKEAQTLAGDQSQKLTGKDLIKAGTKQVIYGTTVTPITAITGVFWGAIGGGIVGEATNRLGLNLDNYISSVGAGGTIGGIPGYEQASRAYNKYVRYGDKSAPKRSNTEKFFGDHTKLPEVNMFDQIVGHIFLLLAGRRHIYFFINPTNVSGMRHIIQGVGGLGSEKVQERRLQHVQDTIQITQESV